MNEWRDPAAGRRLTGGLLTVHAHPDDETLSNGALLATWAASGRPVTVVTCTRGEQGEVIGLDLAHLEGDGPALAAHRETELAGALAALGVEDHVFLDTVELLGAVGEPAPHADGCATASRRFVDSGMSWATTGRATAPEQVPAGAFVTVPLDDAAARLAVVLRDRRPDVVVCDEPGGGYGHPDHVQAHLVVQRALGLAASTDAHLPGEPHRVTAALWTVLDEATLRTGYAAVRALDGERALGGSGIPWVVPDPTGPVPSAAVSAVDLAVAVRPVLNRVLAALRAHATQVQGVQQVPEAAAPQVVAVYALSNDVLLPVLSSETYRLAPGPWAGPVDWPVGVTAVA